MFAPDDACGFQHFRPNHDTAFFGVRRSNYVPIPTKEITMDWRDKSACLTVDPELFFPVGNTGPALDQIEKAKQVCAGCPVRTECLAEPAARPNTSSRNAPSGAFRQLTGFAGTM